MNTPPGAQKLIDLRKSGLVPDCPVIVTYVGEVPHIDALHIYPKSGVAYDWCFMTGLQAYVIVDSKTDAENCIKKLCECGLAAHLGICDVDRKQVSFIVKLNPPILMECKPECDWWQQFFGDAE